MVGIPHPIALERVFFTRTIVVAVPEHQPSEEMNLTSAPENHIEIQEIEGSPGRYQASMRTVLNHGALPSDPYSIDIECIGIFVADDSLPPEKKQRGILITAHSVLYGAIREAVAWITGRHPYGQLMLGLSVLPSGPPSEDKNSH